MRAYATFQRARQTVKDRPEFHCRAFRPECNARSQKRAWKMNLNRATGLKPRQNYVKTRQWKCFCRLAVIESRTDSVHYHHHQLQSEYRRYKQLYQYRYFDPLIPRIILFTLRSVIVEMYIFDQMVPVDISIRWFHDWTTNISPAQSNYIFLHTAWKHIIHNKRRNKKFAVKFIKIAKNLCNKNIFFTSFTKIF